MKVGNLSWLLATVCAAMCGVSSADVVTNTWIAPAGGVPVATNEFGVYANWFGAPTNLSEILNKVCDFPLADRAQITAGGVQFKSAGMYFHPWEASEAEVPSSSSDPATWPTWFIHNEKDTQQFLFDTHVLGYHPLCVQDGWLVLGGGWRLTMSGGDPIRKEGNGYLRISSLYFAKDADRPLEVVGGKVFPMVQQTLAYTDVRVTDPAGHFVFTNYTSSVMVGALSSTTGEPIDLQGCNLKMGAMAATVVPGELSGTGAVTAIDRSVYVTNILPNIVYGAAGGRLRLDSVDPSAVPVIAYDFEESLTADSSGNNRALTSGGAVTRVYDEERGGYVARFSATATTGGKLFVTLDGTDDLSGDTDYTISLWAKANAPCANNWPSFVSIGNNTVDHSLIQFRFQDANCNALLLGHWTSRGDFKDISPTTLPTDPASWNPNAWHHYVAVREGGDVRVYVDGRAIYERKNLGLEMSVAKPAKIRIGHLFDWGNIGERFFAGDIDDVRIYSQAMGMGSVQRLYAGLDPVQNGAGEVKGAPLAIPEGTKLSLGLNGQIQLAGEPTFAATNITVSGIRGGLDLPTGGTLSLTGPGSYNGNLSGTAEFAKTGMERLEVSGALTHTGGTTVKGGTLALQNEATLPRRFAVYDFEQGLGVDSSGNGYTLTSQSGVTRQWDDDRGGYVANFPGTADQKLEASIDSGLLVGDADYTLSAWVKPAADCPTTGTFVSLGRESDMKEIVFRYQNINGGTLVYSHWGGTFDFTGIYTLNNPQGAWHHYVAVRRGQTFTVYCDGVQKWTTTKDGALNLETKKAVCLGRQVNKTDRQFKGLMDDVRIYARALDADQIAVLNRRGEPSVVVKGSVLDAQANIPAPVMHYAFENVQRPGFDSASGASHLKQMGDGTFEFIDSPLGGKALKFDAYNPVYLRSESFPTAVPVNGKPFTVSLWAQTASSDMRSAASATDKTLQTPTFLCWGDSAAKTVSYMMCYFHDPNAIHSFNALRVYMGKSDGSTAMDRNFGDGNELIGLRSGEPALRWHHYATVYDPEKGVANYIDGKYLAADSSNDKFTSRDATANSVFYLGSKSTVEGGASFHGALDEVKIFDVALTEKQIRELVRADAGALRVLPKGGAVTVDAGAKLEVNGTDETIGALTGEGTVDLSSGVLAITNATSTFSGALKGEGLLRLAAGGSLTLAQKPTDFTGYVELAGGSLTLPEGAGKIPATFRVTPIDTAATTACAGDVEIPDGTALTVQKSANGPFVTSAGRVIVMGGGSVTLADAKASGSWIIGRGAEEVLDKGTGDLSARWTVTNLPANRKAKFLVQNGDFVCAVYAGGTLLLVR